MESKYENGKIYKIVSDQTTRIYIGSTCQKLCRRMANHRIDYKRYRNSHKYTVFKVLKYDDAKIVLIEDFPCGSKEQLFARERHYIESMVCTNKKIPGRTHKEYMKDTNYYERHQKERDSQKVECDCGMIHSYGKTSRHKRSKRHQEWENNK